jgi:alanine racemase
VPAAVAAGVDLSVATPLQVAQVAAAARAAGRPARVHLKIDTGLSRGGATAADWPDLVAAVGPLAAEGVLVPMGAWSHFAFADEPEHPVNLAQVGRLVDAADVARRMGVPLPLRHLANSAAVLTRPEAHLELVRPGVSVYGLSPVPDLGGPEAFGLRPAMTLTARAALVKRVPAGSGVSYSHRYTTTRETSLLLVPLGYADGIPRAASSLGPVLAAGAVRRVAGRVCMDQFVLDIGDDAAAAGDPVVLFGPGDAGEPTAQDWADAADTIHYEITTRLGVRVPRVYVGTAGRALGDGGGAAAEGGR